MESGIGCGPVAASIKGGGGGGRAEGGESVERSGSRESNGGGAGEGGPAAIGREPRVWASVDLGTKLQDSGIAR
jgi:hypothetical protein